MGAAVPQHKPNMHLSDFLGSRIPLFSPNAASALSAFHAFASAVLDEGFDKCLQRWIPTADEDLIGMLNAIADRLTGPLEGVSKDIFSKSVKESLFIAANIEELDLDSLKDGVLRFLKRRGSSNLVQTMFSLYVFHTVWSEIQGRMPDAEDGVGLEISPQKIQRICISNVASTLHQWRQQKNPALLDTDLARRFLSQIEGSLIKTPL